MTVKDYENAMRDSFRELYPEEFNMEAARWCHDVAVRLYAKREGRRKDVATDWTALVQKVSGNVAKMGRAYLHTMARF